jgi:homoserine O-succinyltransferase
MPILLPEGHPSAPLAVPRREGENRRRVRIGIINIMPRLEAYEPHLLGPLARAHALVEPLFVRLQSHAYQSSDHGHLDRFYRTFDAISEEAPLDGLILTGAPVEELPFEKVRYWRELREILVHARREVTSTLGICWGGLALARVLGIEKRLFSKKLFGVFEERILVPDHDVLSVSAPSFVCAQSRHSGVVKDELDGAAREGVVRCLSRGEVSGTSIFETPDARYLAHLGHPEYEGDRLAFEWKRDRELGRTDVEAPVDFDADAPTTPWRDHRETLFSGFVARVSAGAGVLARSSGFARP